MTDGCMSTTEARLAFAPLGTPSHESGAIPFAALHASAAIVPPNSIAGRALIYVIAIMTFLAALTLGAVVLVRSATNEWQSQVAREVTVQVRPTTGRNFDADVARAAELARATPGVEAAKA